MTPDGVTDISPGSPGPGVRSLGLHDPGGVEDVCDPSRVVLVNLESGGVAALNHRLISGIPPGCNPNSSEAESKTYACKPLSPFASFMMAPSPAEQQQPVARRLSFPACGARPR